MALSAIKTTTGYVVEGTDAVGNQVELFFDSYETRNYDQLVDFEATFFKNLEFNEARKNLPDPERDLYLQIFGADDVQEDTVLHTTLVEPQDAQDGLSLDWSQDPVTVILRLISKGQSDRLRLIAGRLVDMGATVQSTPAPAGTNMHTGCNCS